MSEELHSKEIDNPVFSILVGVPSDFSRTDLLRQGRLPFDESIYEMEVNSGLVSVGGGSKEIKPIDWLIKEMGGDFERLRRLNMAFPSSWQFLADSLSRPYSLALIAGGMDPRLVWEGIISPRSTADRDLLPSFLRFKGFKTEDLVFEGGPFPPVEFPSVCLTKEERFLLEQQRKSRQLQIANGILMNGLTSAASQKEQGGKTITSLSGKLTEVYGCPVSNLTIETSLYKDQYSVFPVIGERYDGYDERHPDECFEDRFLHSMVVVISPEKSDKVKSLREYVFGKKSLIQPFYNCSFS